MIHKSIYSKNHKMLIRIRVHNSILIAKFNVNKKQTELISKFDQIINHLKMHWVKYYRKKKLKLSFFMYSKFITLLSELVQSNTRLLRFFQTH